jgi:hypothetical protein
LLNPLLRLISLNQFAYISFTVCSLNFIAHSTNILYKLFKSHSLKKLSNVYLEWTIARCRTMNSSRNS